MSYRNWTLSQRWRKRQSPKLTTMDVILELLPSLEGKGGVPISRRWIPKTHYDRWIESLQWWTLTLAMAVEAKSATTGTYPQNNGWGNICKRQTPTPVMMIETKITNGRLLLLQWWSRQNPQMMNSHSHNDGQDKICNGRLLLQWWSR